MSLFANIEADLEAWWKGFQPQVQSAEATVGADLAAAGKSEAQIVATAVAKVAPTIATTAISDLVSGKPSQIASGTSALLAATAAEVASQTETVAADTLIEGVQQGVNSIVSTAKAAS